MGHAASRVTRHALKPTISVVVVLYNSADGLSECLRPIAEDVRSGWAELLLVDNASPDDSANIGKQVIPEAVIVSLDRNLGFAGGANAGIARASGRFVMLL